MKSSSKISPSPLPISLSSWQLDTIFLFVLLLAAVVVNIRMIRYGLNGLGDLRWHLTWIQHFSHQLSEGILYPRWLAGTNFGYGSPTFVFYPPLVYYLGSIIKLLGFNIEQTMSIVFTLPVFLAGVSFYVYGRSKWGKLPACVAAIFYINTGWVFGNLKGGGLPSLYVLIWLPLGVFLIDRALTQPRWRIPLAFLWLAVALTHTPSLLIYAIAGLIYILSAFLRHPAKAVIFTLLSMGAGLGMASFYLLPAILEQKFTNIDYAIKFFGGTPGYFITLQELWQAKFASSYVQQLLWIALFLSLSLLCWRKDSAKRKETLLWLIPLGIVLFMRWDGSQFVWQMFPLLQKLQRPARIDMLIHFTSAALCGIAMSGILQLRLPLKLFLSTIIATILLFNFQSGYKSAVKVPGLHSPGQGKVFIREWLETILYDPYSEQLIDVPEYRPPLTIEGTPPPFERERYTDSGLPKQDKIADNSPLPIPDIGQEKASIINGVGDINIEDWGSYQRKLTVNLQEAGQIAIRTYYYPAWKLQVNGNHHPLEKSEDGTLLVNLETGNHSLDLSYGWTSALVIGVLLSIVSLLVVVGYGYFVYRF